MNENTKGAGLASLMVMLLAVAAPLIAVPTAMLSMSSRDVDSESQSGAASKTTASSKADSPDRSINQADRLLKEFFGQTLTVTALKVREKYLPRCDSTVHVRGLIVTLPDPQDSSLGYLFDVRLDVLRKAAATHGYTLDRVYLPWPRGRLESSSLDLARKEPGLLLFRRGASQPGSTDLLLMYLVGETPASGIQYEAFANAVEGLLFWTRRKPSSLDVIGPSFSGAADSLARAIRSAKSEEETEVTFRVLSGSANGLNPDRFQQLAGPGVTLYSTRPSTERSKDELLKFVSEHCLSGRPLRIAWLVESSGFGLFSKSKDQKIEMTNFSFPLNVASVRRELKKQSSKPNRSPLHVSSLNGSRIPLEGDEAAARQDVLAPFAPGISPALDELQLRHLMTTIRQGEFSYVGITATDPRDTAFLCELIRQHCPDAQILLIGGSTMFVHPNYRQFLRGALTATGYPLHLPTQSWTFPWGANPARLETNETPRPPSWMLTPDSDSSTGVYNAAVLLLASPQQGIWDGPKFTPQIGDPSIKELELVDYGGPFGVADNDGFQPTVWISAVGNETLVPLATASKQVPNSPPLVTVSPSMRERGRRPRVVFPFSGGLFAALLAALTAYGWMMSCVLSRQGGAPQTYLPHRGWWRTWTDELIPLLLPRNRDRQFNDRCSPRQRQLGALLLASLGLWLLTTWLSALAFVPVVLNAQSGGPLRLWLSLIAAVVLIAGCSRGVAFVDAKCRVRPAVLPSPAAHGSARLLSAVRWGLGIVVVVGAILYASGWEFGHLAGDKSLETMHWLGMLVCFHCAWFWLSVSLSYLAELRNPDVTIRWWVITGFAIQSAFLAAIGYVTGLKTDGHAALDSEWGNRAVLWFSQTLSITNQVSLLQSALWLVLAIVAWSGFVLRRLLVSERHTSNTLPWDAVPVQAQSENPLAVVSVRMTFTKDFIDEVLATGCRALRRNFAVSFVVTFAVALLWLAHLARWSAVSFDSRWITCSVWAVGGVALLAWLHTFWQAVVLRQMIHKLLRQMAWMTTLTESLGRLPERIRVIVGSFMDIRQKRASYFRVRVQYLTYLLQNRTAVQHLPRWAGLLTENIPRQATTPESETCIQNVLSLGSGEPLELAFCEELLNVPVSTRRQDDQVNQIPITRETLNHFGMRIWNGLLEEWHNRPPQRLYPSGKSSGDQLSNGVQTLADNLGEVIRRQLPPVIAGPPPARVDEVTADDWVRAAEEFVAMQVVGYLHSVLTFLYSLIWFLLAITVLFVVGTLAWPLQPQKLLSATAITMLLLVTLFCVLSLLALERDRVHSILRGTTPDRVDFDRSVLLKLATCLAPGLLLLLSHIFPSAMQWLSSLIEPVMHSAQ